MVGRGGKEEKYVKVYKEAVELMNKFEFWGKVSFKWIPREYNKVDELLKAFCHNV